MSSHITPQALARARRVLAILEEKAAAYAPQDLPAHVTIELEDQRSKVAEMEAALGVPLTVPPPQGTLPVPAPDLSTGRGIVVSAPVTNRLKDSVIAVLDQNKNIVGTGFVVDKRLALTCDHVITAAGSAPGKSVRLRFEYDQAEVQALVDARAWSPREQNDIAVLRLEQDAPQEAVPLALVSPADSNGHKFQTFGYPRLAVVVGLSARGLIGDMLNTKDGRKLLQIDSDNIDSGFSGAPVWDSDLLKVVGMVRSALPPSSGGRMEDINFAVPGDVLQDILPKFSRQTQKILSNPFYAGGAVPPADFVGRQDTLDLIRADLSGGNMQNLSIVAERRMGKTSLLRYICANAADLFPENTKVICLDLLQGYARTRKDLLRAFREKFAGQFKGQPWEASLDGDLGEFARALERLDRQELRLVLCLDEVEKLAENETEFGGLFDALRAAADGKSFAMLVTSARPLSKLKKEHGSTSPFYNIFVQETLGLLREEEWRELVVKHMPEATPAELDAIGQLAGGHPFYTQLAARRLWEARHAKGDLDWQSRAYDDILPHWEGWWKYLKAEEQGVLRHSLGLAEVEPKKALLRDLTRRGLLRDGKPFSAEFAEWVREQ